MRFTKIKNSRLNITLEWETKAGDVDVIKHSMTSYSRPEPEFTEALQAFVGPVMNLLELPSGFDEDLEIIGLSINYEGGWEDDELPRRGLVVTCLKKLDRAYAPLVLNTPHLREFMEGDPDGDDNHYLPPEFLSRLHEIQMRARRFIDGKREQGDLFDQAWEEAPESETTGPKAGEGAAADAAPAGDEDTTGPERGASSGADDPDKPADPSGDGVPGPWLVGRKGSVWHVYHRETGDIRTSVTDKAKARKKAAEFNREAETEAVTA